LHLFFSDKSVFITNGTHKARGTLMNRLQVIDERRQTVDLSLEQILKILWLKRSKSWATFPE